MLKVLAGLALAALLNHAALAACTNEPARAAFAEETRIRDCLRDVARGPRRSSAQGNADMELYTWGNGAKIAAMVRDRERFCATENARKQQWEEFDLYKLYPATGPKAQRSLARLSAQYPDLLTLLEAASGAPKPLKNQLQLVAIGKIYPSYLGNAFRVQPGGDADRLAALRRELAASQQGLNQMPSLNAQQRESLWSLEGRLIAFTMLDDKIFAERAGVKSSRPISSSAGLGVYFGADPLAYLEHLPPNGGGLVCRVPRQNVIVDLGNGQTKSALVSRKIVLGADQVGPISNPTGYNAFVRPAAFERAARGFIIRSITKTESMPVYADKCALPYDDPGVCRTITIATLSCSQFDRYMTELAARFAESQRYFASQSEFASNFARQIAQCVPSADSARIFDVYLQGLARAKAPRPLLDAISKDNTLWQALVRAAGYRSCNYSSRAGRIDCSR
ncbi:MAG: hypothetical protein R3E77_02580 [Steroidobacteraceae bacterium]